MIGSVRGTLLDRNMSGSVVIDVNGLGYEVQVSGTTLARLGDVGTEVSLRIHTRVREDAIILYGFVTADEKRTFDILIAAHGVGPSVALGLLAVYSPLELRHIIAMDDSEALSKVPGIGKKTAARIIVELKTKFDIDLDAEAFSAPHATINTQASSAIADVSAALAGLGYQSDEIRAAVAQIPQEGTTSDLLRQALRVLSGAAQ